MRCLGIQQSNPAYIWPRPWTGKFYFESDAPWVHRDSTADLCGRPDVRQFPFHLRQLKLKVKVGKSKIEIIVQVGYNILFQFWVEGCFLNGKMYIISALHPFCMRLIFYVVQQQFWTWLSFVRVERPSEMVCPHEKYSAFKIGDYIFLQMKAIKLFRSQGSSNFVNFKFNVFISKVQG